jgi:sialidase-1
MKRYVVARGDEVYECFPDLVRLDDARLLCIYRESQGHVPSSYTRVIVRESLDEGRTWGDRHVLAETTGTVDQHPGWNCPRISQLDDGRIVAVCDLMTWPEGKDLNRRSRIHTWWSDDGRSWDGPRPTRMTGIVPDKVSRLASGDLVVGSQDCSPETGNLRQLLWRSHDGEEWTGPVTVADHPGLNLCEGSIIEHKGRIACLMRENSGRGLPGYKSTSTDSGDSFGKPIPVPLPGCHRPVAGWWGDDILVTYRCYMGAGMKNTLFMGALLSSEEFFHDEGLPQNGRIFPIDYDRSPRPDTGYSGWCVLPDQDAYIVNYIVDDAPKAQIRGYRLSKREVVASQENAGG